MLGGEKLSDLDYCGKALGEIFNQKFGGKDQGHYRILRRNLRLLSKSKNLTDEVIGYLSMYLADHYDLILLNCESYFGVIELRKTARYRRVTRKILGNYILAVNEE